jgi:general secretion pathway protein D
VRQSSTGGVTINVVEASVAEVARSVLGETMGVTYVVDPRVKGSLTLRTAQPVPKEALVEIFEQALRSEGAVMVVEGGVYKILPAEAVGTAVAGLRSGSRGRRPGYGTEIIPLRYVSAEEIERVIKAVAPQASIVRVDPNRNLVMVAGTSLELTSIRETVSVFDVDWMRGMSFALYPVDTGDPEAIVQELDTIFANDRDSPTKGVVRFVPNRRLKSILVITSRPEYLTKASTWLKRIDMAGRATEKQVHVYHVQNRPATELSTLLQRVYTSQARATTGALPTSPAAGQVSLTGPADAPVTEPSSGSSNNGRRGFDSGVPIFSPVPLASPPSPAAPPPGSADAGQSGLTAGATPGASPVPGDDRGAGISVIADEANNSLIITATPGEYKRIQQILTRIDIAPSQVLLEATIAEVTLNDRLKFGLRWFFRAGDSQLRLTDSAVGAVGATFPGFSYFLNVPNVQVALNALTTVTDVNVVSSPSLVVLDNKKATLQVGAEVPVATQSAVSIISPGAPIVNSVTFRSTGVILGITPRISENGRVLLEIEQEVSDVVPTTTSNIDSPTIQQRRVKTTVAVNDGESIVLAGLMQDTNTVTKKQIPLVGQLPVVGNLFKDKDDEIKRTELLIAITPQIVKDAHQMRAIASEFRDRMNFTTRPQRRAPPDRREQVDRLVR